MPRPESEIHFIKPRASPASAINSSVCSTRNGHVKSSQRESDTQYLLCMDLRVGGVWVKGYEALVKSPRAIV